MISLRDVVIIGGGCYGSFYTGQLLKAREAGAVSWRRLLVVDRDPECSAALLVAEAGDAELVTAEWGRFLDRWLVQDERSADDRLVPSPLMPHLMAEWLERRAAERFGTDRVGRVPADTVAGTPFDWLSPTDGVRYVSHADWTCPVHCIEPATCPVIKAPRRWEMSDTVTEWSHRRGSTFPTAGPVLFTCRHHTHGVGMYPVSQGFDALDQLAAAVEQHGKADLVVGSVSACHGAVGVIRVTGDR